MKIALQHTVGFVAVTTLLALTNASAATGTVVDGSNGKPMAGVHIVASWTGTAAMPVQSSTRCYHAEATVSDGRGQFKLSSFTGNWDPLLLGRSRAVWALAPGYQTSSQSNFDDLTIVLTPANGAKSEQFKGLPRTYVLGCGVDNRQFLPFLRDLYKETLRVATTLEERKIVSARLFDIEYIELGEQEAYRRSSERLRAELLGEQK